VASTSQALDQSCVHDTDCTGTNEFCDVDVCRTRSCNLLAPFDPPELAFTGTGIASGLTFSQDQRTAYVSSKTSPSAPFAINFTSRLSTSNAFDPLTPVTALNSGPDDHGPALSDDGLTLYLTKLNSSNWTYDLAKATRTSTEVQFDNVQFLTALNNSSFHDQDPFFLSRTSELYYASEWPTGTRDLYVSKFDSGVYQTPTALSVNLPSAEDFRPVLSRDGLTLYFASSRPGIGNDTESDIWMARRSGVEQQFGSATNLFGLNSSYIDFPVALADGDCTLYFGSTQDTGSSSWDSRLYRAKRGTSIPSSVTTTLQIIGSGSVNTPPFQCSTSCSAQGAPDSNIVVQASGSAHWHGSCTSNGGEPSSDGVLVFTNGGVCTVDFNNAGNGTTGSKCFTDANCSSGLYCVSGTCGPACTPSCSGKACGADNGCGAVCDCDTTCTSDAQCPSGFACSSSNQCGPPGGEPGSDCGTDADCGSGLVCGTHNGGCFEGSRAQNVCWPAACEAGSSYDCGRPDSFCGSVCACVRSCDADDPTSNPCVAGDVCERGIGTLFEAPYPDVCIPSGVVCPSNDPAYCGTRTSICGQSCIPLPDCSHATCANPSDGAGGICPGVCPIGGNPDGTGTCTDDIECPAGSSCHPEADGLRRCRRDDLCPPGTTVAPPLCGSPSAPCGVTCPTNTPQCQGRECGPDPLFGQSCGSCAGGSFCSAEGKCVQPTSDPPPLVPDGSGGSVPLEPLPTAPANTVGAIPGTFSVSDGGTAQYDIPIEVPPGRAGMAPTLSLHYGGTNRYTDQGAGWQLQGLSRITRCPRTQAMDGYAAPIKNDTGDHFCLDGQRLIVTNGGSPGGDGTVYHTAVDSFAKVTSRRDPEGQELQAFDPFAHIDRIDRSLQGPDYFEVQTRDGRKLTFGHTIASLGVADNGVRFAWLLSEVRDRSGNTITFDYDKVGGALEGTLYVSRFHPKTISYTGHGDTPGNRTVRFNYEDRPDPTFRFQQSGLYAYEGQRLHSISTYVNSDSERFTADGRVSVGELARS
jgi:hypothetical protein